MRGWLILAVIVVPVTGAAQGYRLRLDTRGQSVAYRGVTLDSIAVTDTVTGPTGGPTTPDGYAVRCTGGAYCTYFRPGGIQRGAPITALADLALWGLGVPGLSARATARLGVDLGDDEAWPGLDPALQLLEGYAEYAVERGTARLGRQVVASRLGTTGFDGAWVTVRDRRRGLEATAYAGWGLARGTALPVTSPALNPLDDFQPRQRQLLAGVGAGWSRALAEIRLEYQREVDPRSDYFVSERIGLQTVVRPVPGLGFSGGADYDLAAGWWGSAEASLTYTEAPYAALIGARRYRPHFDLWTIWGAFSPVPYSATHAAVSIAPLPEIELRLRGERYVFDNDEAATPLTSGERDGWRWEAGGTARFRERWMLDGSFHRELGPGAASVGVAGRLTFVPAAPWTLALHAASLDRPLEFRFNEAVVHAFGLDAEYQPNARARVGISASRYAQHHHRPDSAAFDWSQTRVSARVILLFGQAADLSRLPPGARRP